MSCEWRRSATLTLPSPRSSGGFSQGTPAGGKLHHRVTEKYSVVSAQPARALYLCVFVVVSVSRVCNGFDKCLYGHMCLWSVARLPQPPGKARVAAGTVPAYLSQLQFVSQCDTTLSNSSRLNFRRSRSPNRRTEPSTELSMIQLVVGCLDCGTCTCAALDIRSRRAAAVQYEVSLRPYPPLSDPFVRRRGAQLIPTPLRTPAAFPPVQR